MFILVQVSAKQSGPLFSKIQARITPALQCDTDGKHECVQGESQEVSVWLPRPDGVSLPALQVALTMVLTDNPVLTKTWMKEVATVLGHWRAEITIRQLIKSCDHELPEFAANLPAEYQGFAWAQIDRLLNCPTPVRCVAMQTETPRSITPEVESIWTAGSDWPRTESVSPWENLQEDAHKSTPMVRPPYREWGLKVIAQTSAEAISTPPVTQSPTSAVVPNDLKQTTTGQTLTSQVDTNGTPQLVHEPTAHERQAVNPNTTSQREENLVSSSINPILTRPTSESRISESDLANLLDNMTDKSANPEETVTQTAGTDTAAESAQVPQASLPNMGLSSVEYDLSPPQPPIPGIGFNAIRCAAPSQQVPMTMGGNQILMPTPFMAQNPVAESLQGLQTMVNGIPQIVFGTPTVPTIKFPVPTLTARPSLVDPDQLIWFKRTAGRPKGGRVHSRPPFAKN